MTSPKSSTPSYICEIEAQFDIQPLLNFQLLDTPNTFELSITYQAHKEDSPEPCTLPPILISPNVHESLIDQMAQDTICEDTLVDDHPGDGWELSHLAIHNHRILVHNPETNMSQPANYMRFMVSKHDGKPEMWGTDSLGQDILGDPLFAKPCFDNVHLGIDDTDLAMFVDINMLRKDKEVAIWNLNNYGVLTDIHCLCQEPAKKCKLEKHHTMKNHIYDLAALFQAEYLQDIQEFHCKQLDV